jgi:hypothetical protein
MPVYRYVSPGHNVVDHVSEMGHVEIEADGVPGFVLGTVRAVFGAPTSQGLDRGAFNDEFGGRPNGPPTTKGSVIYEDLQQELHVNSAALTDDVTFVLVESVRMPCRGHLGDLATDGDSNECGAGDIQMIHQRYDIVGLRLETIVAIARWRGLSVATQVKGQDAEILRQSRSLAIPQFLAGGQGMTKDQPFALRWRRQIVQMRLRSAGPKRDPRCG